MANNQNTLMALDLGIRVLQLALAAKEIAPEIRDRVIQTSETILEARKEGKPIPDSVIDDLLAQDAALSATIAKG